MKKYLMLGVAALALASCNKTDFESYTQEQIVEAKYNQAFVNTFGQPAANHTWGFGTTRAANVNGNQWHDANYFNLEYDAPVTTEEKNLVFNYVNNSANVETIDQISFTEYWVAQIWNGSEDANATGVKAPTSTSYPDQSGNTTTIVGGAQMDKLEILESEGTWTHCNNFNSANNTDWKEGGEGGRTLMTSSGTLSFRYTNSQSSFLSEKYIIVPGEKINASLKGFYYVCFDFERGYDAEEYKNEKTMGSYEAWNGNNYQGGWNFTLDGFLNEDQVKTAIGQVNGKDIQNINIKGYMYGDKHCDGDGNYTDWIVRISPAKEKYDGRIMGEDLSASEGSDFDFNDVVFDYKFVEGGVNILLQAAGGTLPLKIGGTKESDIDGFEVHNLFKVNTNIMVNTATDYSPKIVMKDAVSFFLEGDFGGDAINIPIFVKKNGEWMELTARRGNPASKFRCAITTKWVDEYINIDWAYPLFDEWVADPTVDWESVVVEKFVNLIIRQPNDNIGAGPESVTE